MMRNMKYGFILTAAASFYFVSCQKEAIDINTKDIVESIDTEELTNTSVYLRGQNNSGGILYLVTLETKLLSIENQYLCSAGKNGELSIEPLKKKKVVGVIKNEVIIRKLIQIIEKLDVWGYSVDSCENQYLFNESFGSAQFMYLGRNQCSQIDEDWKKLSLDENWFRKR